tara:strand:- start:20035 stop:21312 length:1278 start_codon:yes stop_codon:yes gene_type:complete
MINANKLTNDFLTKYSGATSTLYNMFFKKNNFISLNDFNLQLKDDLIKSIINNKDNEDEDDTYDVNRTLLYIANEFCKTKIKEFNENKSNIEYICPACLFLSKTSLLQKERDILFCKECSSLLSEEKDLKKIFLFSKFALHKKNGYHCSDCERFIPSPHDNIKIISCPYFDCCFVGNIDSLRKMNHPKFNHTIDNMVTPSISYKDVSCKNNTNFKILKEIIESEKNILSYDNNNIMQKQKLTAYQSISNLLDKSPQLMIDYLLNNSRTGGFQNKLFQEYISILENSLPILIKLKNKPYKIESLLDVNLSLFDGISNFDSIINDKMCIKNNTNEFYIGGRKATYAKPYYIGKLLFVVDKKTNESLNDNILEYSFSKIKMKNVKPGTEVSVSHLRIPPHYQMGAMVYINRARKIIIDHFEKYYKNIT